MRAWRVAVALLLAVALIPLGAAGTSVAAVPRTSLTAVEDDVMCPTCREPLALAQSPQAISERAYIETLVARGMTKQQIEQALVAQYGSAVLGRPPAHGFNLTVYILPPALLLAGLAALAVVVPRWRRRARAAERSDEGPTVSAADADRLERDMARLEL